MSETDKETPEYFSINSLSYFQKMVQKSGPAAGASYALIGAVLLFGLLGYYLDSLFQSEPWFLLGGILLGIISGFYQLAKIIWLNK
ncbi:MAG: AtpZ/AtpI family protein [Candidatus Marinimicrobia bacterium]|nr:AtpZ/AtpI family protein [Candidatus Neomarinimicrobiota bacterium]